MTPQTISEVIQQLDVIISISRNSNSRQAYFAILYRQMTVAVQKAIANNEFENPARMERLDVIFATRYLDAWQAYSEKKPCSQAWLSAFDAAEKKELIIIQHLILGINAHINLDLGMAAALTAPGEAIWGLQQDFDKINDLISNLAGAMQTKLERLSWPMKLLTNITNGKEKALINFSITKAREASWTNALALSQLNEEAQAAYLKTLDDGVNMLAQKITTPGTMLGMLLKVIRWFEPKTTAEVCNKLS